MNREEFFKSLKFADTGKTGVARHTSDYNVSIAIHSPSKNCSNKRLTITFRDGCDKRLGDGDRIKVALFKNRVIIVKDERGIKLTSNASSYSNSSKYATFTINNDVLFGISKFVGDYNLTYDSLYEYYYVEKEV